MAHKSSDLSDGERSLRRKLIGLIKVSKHQYIIPDKSHVGLPLSAKDAFHHSTMLSVSAMREVLNRFQ